MSIDARIADALALWEGKRAEGALLQILVAIAATSRLRYPQDTPSRRDRAKKMGDAEAFETFLDEELPNISDFSSFRIVFEGELISLGRVLYKWFRCSLLHEGRLAPEVGLIASRIPGRLEIRNEAGPPPRVMVSELFVVLLADLTCRAPENRELLSDLRERFIRHASTG